MKSVFCNTPQKLTDTMVAKNINHVFCTLQKTENMYFAAEC